MIATLSPMIARCPETLSHEYSEVIDFYFMHTMGVNSLIWSLLTKAFHTWFVKKYQLEYKNIHPVCSYAGIIPRPKCRVGVHGLLTRI